MNRKGGQNFKSMKKIKLIKNSMLILILILLLFLVLSILVINNNSKTNIIPTVSESNSTISLEADKQNIKIGDEIEVSINTNQIAIAACTIHLYFDSNKLEVIDIPDNANVIENQIIYIWFDKRR